MLKNKRLPIILFVLFLFDINMVMAADGWSANSTVTKSLTTTSGFAEPRIVYNFTPNYFTAIVGSNDGTFIGRYWNGTQWVTNATLVNGLVDVGTYSSPGLIYGLFSGKWVLIAGAVDGNFDGYVWNGSGWSANSTAINGLSDIGSNSAPFMFTNFFGLGDFDLIDSQTFTGFVWNGTSWKSNTTLVNGVTGLGSYNKLSVIYNLIASTWILLSGDADNGIVSGFSWNGTSWNNYPAIKNGLADLNDNYASPTIFYGQFTDKWSLLVGEADGGYEGFVWNGTNPVTDPCVYSGSGAWSITGNCTIQNAYAVTGTLTINASSNVLLNNTLTATDFSLLDTASFGVLDTWNFGVLK